MNFADGLFTSAEGVNRGQVCLRGICVAVIFQRFLVGESMQELAADYEMPAIQIEQAIRLYLVALDRNDRFSWDDEGDRRGVIETRMRELIGGGL